MQASTHLRHLLPSDRCCNCESRLGLTMLGMEFPLGSGGLFEAERWALVIRAPFCALCAPSARRRRLRFVEKFFLGFALFFLLVVGTSALPEAAALDPMIQLVSAVSIGFGLPFALPKLLRPHRGQSSYWRPVGVEVPRARAANRRLENLAFEFTSASYARSFALVNAKAIANGAITARHRPG